MSPTLLEVAEPTFAEANESRDAARSRLLADAGLSNPLRIPADRMLQMPSVSTSSRNMLSDAVDKFEQAPDKKVAMPGLKKDFEDAIKRADEEYDEVDKRVGPGLRLMAPDMAKAMARVNPLYTRLFQSVDKAPNVDKNEVRRLSFRYLHMDPSDPERAEIGRALPLSVMQAADDLASELRATAPIRQAYNIMAIERESAINRCYETRSTYADKLRQAGYPHDAETVTRDAMNVLRKGRDFASEVLERQEQRRSFSEVMRNIKELLRTNQ